MSKPSYYDIMNVKSDANLSDIKRSYRKLAMEYHPDKNPDGGEKFKEITKAYEVISDPEKRQIYDQYGEDGPPKVQANPFGDIFNNFFSGQNNPFQGGPFGGGNPFNGNPFQQSHPPTEINDLNILVEISLAELYHGTTKSLTFSRKKYCQPCDGSGSMTRKLQTCPTCSGSRMITKIQQMGGMRVMNQQPCPKCKATGKYVDPQVACRDCKGQGYNSEETTIDCIIPPGSRDDHPIQLPNAGNEGPNGRGPVNIKLHELPQPEDSYRRRGANNLVYEISLDYCELMFGFTVSIPHPTGVLTCTYRGESYPDDYFCLPEKGMPFQSDPSRHGDYYIVIKSVTRRYNTDQTWQELIKLSTTPPSENDLPTNVIILSHPQHN